VGKEMKTFKFPGASHWLRCICSPTVHIFEASPFAIVNCLAVLIAKYVNVVEATTTVTNFFHFVTGCIALVECQYRPNNQKGENFHYYFVSRF
jgi:hypothetical protein